MDVFAERLPMHCFSSRLSVTHNYRWSFNFNTISTLPSTLTEQKMKVGLSTHASVPIAITDPLHLSPLPRFKPQQEPQHASSSKDVPIDAAAAPVGTPGAKPAHFRHYSTNSIDAISTSLTGTSLNDGTNAPQQRRDSAGEASRAGADARMAADTLSMGSSSQSHSTASVTSEANTQSTGNPDPLVLVDSSLRSKMVRLVSLDGWQSVA